MLNFQYSPNIMQRIGKMIESHDKSQSFIKDFVYLFETRASIEINYCLGLENLCEEINKLSQQQYYDENVSKLLISLRSSILTQSEQGNILASNLKAFVCQIMNQLSQSHFTNLNQLSQQATQIEQGLQNQINIVEKSKYDYSKTVLDLKQLQVKEGKDFEEAQQRQQQSKQDLQNQVDQFNQVVQNYFQTITEYAEHEVKMAQERSLAIQDSLTQFLVQQISYIKTIEYDFNQIAKKLEQYQIPKFLAWQDPPSDSPLLSFLNLENLIEYIEYEYIPIQEQQQLEEKAIQNIKRDIPRKVIYLEQKGVDLQNAYKQIKGYFSFKKKDSENKKLFYLEKLFQDVLEDSQFVWTEEKEKEVIFEIQKDKKNIEYFQQFLKKQQSAQIQAQGKQFIILGKIIKIILLQNLGNPQNILTWLQETKLIFQKCGFSQIFQQEIIQNEQINDKIYWIMFYSANHHKQQSSLDKLDNIICKLVVDQNLLQVKIKRTFQDLKIAGFSLKFCKEVCYSLVETIQFKEQNDKNTILEELEKLSKERIKPKIFENFQENTNILNNSDSNQMQISANQTNSNSNQKNQFQVTFKREENQ